MGAEVKYMHSGMTGAPSIAGVAGNMIALLDACLINGWGSNTVDSVVVASGIATVTRSAGHPFEIDSVAEISGATPSGLNGQKKVLSVTGTTYTFDATGISNGTATGTISHKMAALGFTKQYSGTNLAAYKSANVAATACLLRVDDTGTTSARVVAYETMSDVNTGTGPFPTSAQMSGGLYWPKSNAADATTRPWVLFGDDRAFYLYVGYFTASGTTSMTMGFGDFISKKTPDAYGAFVNGATTTPSNVSRNEDEFNIHSSASTANGFFCPRAYTGIGSSISVTRAASPAIGSSAAASGNFSSGLAYPNAADSGLYITPMYVGEQTSGNILRGVVPGLYFAAMTGLTTGGIGHRDRITGVTSLSGKALRAINNNAAAGIGFVDCTGPWR